MFAQPGKRQPLSRAFKTRLSGAEIVRVLRPTLSGSPSSFSTSATTLASHDSRRAVSADIEGPCSNSQHPAARSRKRFFGHMHDDLITLGAGGFDRAVREEALGDQAQGIRAARAERNRRHRRSRGNVLRQILDRDVERFHDARAHLRRQAGRSARASRHRRIESSPPGFAAAAPRATTPRPPGNGDMHAPASRRAARCRARRSSAGSLRSQARQRA